jgi:hypothetical protein
VSKQSERIYRSLRGLEKTASTSRVLNLAAIAVKYAGDPEHAKEPLFHATNLGAAVIIKHRLRVDELENFDDMVRTATKLIIPFDRANLGLGGRALFVGENNWMERLADLRGSVDGLQRDAEVLHAIDELPSLDPFLLREHLKRRGFRVFCVFRGSKAASRRYPNGFSKLGWGWVNQAAPVSVTWKWSSRRTPNAPGITIIGSLEKHMPGASGVLSPRTR